MRGIIKLIPITEPKKKLQVIFRNQIAIVGLRFKDAYEDDKLNIDFKPSYAVINEWLSPEMESELSQLIIEYSNCCGRCNGIDDICDATIKQLPIQNSQWQYILDNNLVDIGVDFEIVKTGIRGTENSFPRSYNTFETAQITIPQEKKFYTEEEIIKFSEWCSNKFKRFYPKDRKVDDVVWFPQITFDGVFEKRWYESNELLKIWKQQNK